jgi:hypothetical protein
MLFPSGYCIFCPAIKMVTGSSQLSLTYRNTDLESELKLTYIMTAKMLLCPTYCHTLQITTEHAKSQFL